MSPAFRVSRLPWCFQSWAAEGRVGARALGGESIPLKGCSHKHSFKRANHPAGLPRGVGQKPRLLALAAHTADSAGF